MERHSETELSVLTKEGCQVRLGRLLAAMEELGLGGAVLSDPRELYYFCGLPLPPDQDFAAYALVRSSGHVTVVTTEGRQPLVGDAVDSYPWSIGATRNPDLTRQATLRLKRLIRKGKLGAVGYQAEHLPRETAEAVAEAGATVRWKALDDLIANLERHKDDDELALMKRSIAVTEAAYAAVAEVITPGVGELEVLAAGQRAAMLAAGEPLWHSGDYACGAPGGPARNRPIEAGELYIVDAWSVYRGYWSDLCRTFPVGEPTDLQLAVYHHLVGILEQVPSQLRPGRSGVELAHWMDDQIREHPHLKDIGLKHHAGHGTGLRPHIAPDLNRDREGILQAGDVVCVEPGAYSPELRGGIRIENTYRLTADGCEVLSSYPLSWSQKAG
jgi:Xaa-Pro aminopeptidase